MEDLVGKKFGKITILSYAFTRKNHTYWLGRCECGKEKAYERSTLKYIKSCGCEKIKFLKEHPINTKHNLTGKRIFNIWRGIKSRCLNPNRPKYARYGGRGIRICEEWLGKDGAMNFYNWAMDNGYNDTLTIERINNDGDYCPENCRWASWEEQAANKSTNTYLIINNQKNHIGGWAKVIEIKPNILYSIKQRKGEDYLVEFIRKRIR